MNTLSVSLQIETATLEAITEHRAYTVVGFEPDGELIACIDGAYWVTL